MLQKVIIAGSTLKPYTRKFKLFFLYSFHPDKMIFISGIINTIDQNNKFATVFYVQSTFICELFNLVDSVFKSRDITLPTKIRLVKVMVFPVVMYGCESWTVKKAERRRIDAFEL